MAIVFPTSPSVNDTFTVGSITYKWDGAKWIGLGVTPADRLVEGSNSLEINASNNLVWTGNNVGIGTINPGTLLDVRGSTESSITVGTTSQFYGRLYGSSTLTFVGAYNGADLSFSTNSGASYDSKMIIKNGGNVGIGDINPSDKLTVYNSNVGNATGITIRNTEASSAYSHARLRLESQNATAYGEIWADVANGSLRTGYNSSATTFLTEQGNFGIGSIPASDINGAFRALKIYNNAYVTGYTSNTYPALHLNVNARPTTSSFTAGFVRDVAGTYTHPMSLEMYAGQLTLRGASTGAADSAITWENRFRVESNGNVSIGNGNLVFSTAGTGIDFSANANAAGMTSELLDDYEEGTWSSTIINPVALSAYNFTEGYYTKVGRLVHIVGEITYTPTSSGTELGMVIDAPFAMASNSGAYAGAGAVYWSHARGPGLILDNTSSNNTQLYLLLQSVNNTSSASGTIRFGLTYVAT